MAGSLQIVAQTLPNSTHTLTNASATRRWWYRLWLHIGQNHRKGRGTSNGRWLEPHTISGRKAMALRGPQKHTRITQQSIGMRVGVFRVEKDGNNTTISRGRGENNAKIIKNYCELPQPLWTEQQHNNQPDQ
eukprot:scaffold35752_cov87-Cyclotella_meneghiniana.AAC.1